MSKRVHVLPFTHHDLTWMGTQEECLSRGNRIIALALRRAERNPDFTFHLEDMIFVDHFLRTCPAQTERLRALVEAGRVELGVRWTGLYEDLQPGENFARNLLYGKHLVRRTFGIDPHCISLTDIPGHTAQFPQMLCQAGIEFAALTRSGPRGVYLFHWRALDGSDVLTYDVSELFMGYGWALFRGLNTSIEAMEDLGFATELEQAFEHCAADELLIYAGADLLPPLEYLDENLRRWNQRESERRILSCFSLAYSTLARFYRAVRDTSGIPILEGDAPNTWCYVEPLGIQMFQYELPVSHLLVTAEKLSTLAWVLGYADYPADRLERAWKGLLIAQDHNYDGQGAEAGDRRKLAERRQTQFTAQDLIRQALAPLAERVAVPGEECIPIVVFNPLGWQRSDVVTAHFTSYWRGTADLEWDIIQQADAFVLKDATGRVVPHQVISEVRRHTRDVTFTFIAEDLPSLGYRTFYLHPTKETASSPTSLRYREERGEYVLENARFRVEIDRGTGAVTVHDQELGGVLIEGAQVVEVEESEKTDFCNDFTTGVIRPARLVEATLQGSAGPVAATLLLHYHMDNPAISDLQLALTLYKGLDRVDWEVVMEYLPGERNRFELVLPTPFQTPRVTHGVPFGANEITNRLPNAGPAGSYDREILMSQESWAQTCLVQNWIDLSDGERGLTVATDRQLFRVEGGTLRNVLLRLNPYSCRFSSRFSLLPHQGDWRAAQTWRDGWGLNVPPLTYTVNDTVSPKSLPAERSFLSVSGGEVVLTALKRAEDGEGIVVRMFETTGRAALLSLLAGWPVGRVEQANLLEDIQEEVDLAELAMRSYKILTLRLSRMGKHGL